MTKIKKKVGREERAEAALSEMHAYCTTAFLVILLTFLLFNLISLSSQRHSQKK